GERPESPRGGTEPGQNGPGSPPERPTEEPPPAIDDRDRWGDLPPRAQEIFRSQGRDDVPVRYREWIDAYWRRLNQGG
ncbi:MAG: hypothetical protein AB1726_10910, partial [Planctomycetota bacterium]